MLTKFPVISQFAYGEAAGSRQSTGIGNTLPRVGAAMQTGPMMLFIHALGTVTRALHVLVITTTNATNIRLRLHQSRASAE